MSLYKYNVNVGYSSERAVGGGCEEVWGRFGGGLEVVVSTALSNL